MVRIECSLQLFLGSNVGYNFFGIECTRQHFSVSNLAGNLPARQCPMSLPTSFPPHSKCFALFSTAPLLHSALHSGRFQQFSVRAAQQCICCRFCGWQSCIWMGVAGSRQGGGGCIAVQCIHECALAHKLLTTTSKLMLGLG